MCEALGLIHSTAKNKNNNNKTNKQKPIIGRKGNTITFSDFGTSKGLNLVLAHYYQGHLHVMPVLKKVYEIYNLMFRVLKM